MDSFVKGIGADYTYSCGSLNTVEEEDAQGEALLVMPNPAIDVLYLQVPAWAQGGAHYTIHDATGRLCAQGAYGRQQHLKVGHLASGSYTVRLSDANGKHRAVARFMRH